MPKLLAKILLLFFLCLGMASCDSNAVFDEYENIGKDGWAHKDTVQFRVQQTDSLNPYNLFINLRANQDYPYRNIFLITSMDFPNGKVIKDTLEYNMAKPSGKLLGHSSGNLTESKLWYKEGVVFPEKGGYKFSVRQATRKNGQVKPDDTLHGVTDVGLRIEKIK
jgi:gliding motility-associated lipoprotein GldH